MYELATCAGAPRFTALTFAAFLGCAATGTLLSGCAGAPAGYRERTEAWETIRALQLAAESVELGDAAGLPELLRYAREHNAGLEAAFLRWKAALERVPQARALPEPRLGFAGYLKEVETRTGPLQARVGLVQPLPWFGELDLAGQVAYQASEAAREQTDTVRLDLEQDVRDTWYEYAWLGEAIAITRGHRELLAHWESVARARMETGIGPHSDVIRAQVELGKLEDRVLTLEDLRTPIEARLNAALDRPSDAPLPEPSFPLADPPELDPERLREEFHASSPRLRALGHRVEAARQAIELAGKAFYPDLLVGAEYGFVGSARAPGVPGSGDDTLALTLGLELPIWRSSYRAGVRQAEAEMHAAGSDLDDTHNRLSADLEMALYRFRDADRRVDLFRDSLIPKGEESVQALDTAYQTGQERFLDLIDAERVLLEFQLEAARAEADRAQALAETERITGVPLHQEP